MSTGVITVRLDNYVNPFDGTNVPLSHMGTLDPEKRKMCGVAL